MAPLSPLVGRQLGSVNNRMEENDDSASALELALVTVAVLCSVVLVITEKIKILNHSRYPVFTITAVFVALVGTCTASVLIVAAMILGWLRDISIDAVGAIVFALAPAILSVPSHVFQYFHTYRLVRKQPSLRVATQEFRYIRYGQDGKTCGSDRNASNWNEIWGVCTREHCQVRMYIRRLPKPNNGYHNAVSSRVHQQVNNCLGASSGGTSTEDNSENGSNDAALQWYGHRIGHTKNFVELQDIDDGITSWWWDAVSSASNLVARPSEVHVSNELRMVNALTLISDIISIGDLVLEYRFDFLQHQLRFNKGVKDAVTATPGIMCNLIMERVRLNNWFPIEAKALEEEDYEYPRDSRKKYGLMFLILAEKSEMFAVIPRGRRRQGDEQCRLGERCPLERSDCYVPVLKRRIPSLRKRKEPQRISGQHILDVLTRHGEIDQWLFHDLAAKLVDRWLCDWGCRQAAISEIYPATGVGPT